MPRVCKRSCSEATPAKDQCTPQHPRRLPVGKDDQGDAHPATPSDDPVCKGSQLGQRKKCPAHGHQRAADHQRLRADEEDIQPGGIRRFGVFTHRADLQAKTGAVDQPPDQRDEQQGDVGEQVLLKDWTENRILLEERQRLERLDGRWNTRFAEDEAEAKQGDARPRSG